MPLEKTKCKLRRASINGGPGSGVGSSCRVFLFRVNKHGVAGLCFVALPHCPLELGNVGPVLRLLFNCLAITFLIVPPTHTPPPHHRAPPPPNLHPPFPHSHTHALFNKRRWGWGGGGRGEVKRERQEKQNGPGRFYHMRANFFVAMTLKCCGVIYGRNALECFNVLVGYLIHP